MTPQRGELWRVRLDRTPASETKKIRPCLVVGSDVLNQRRHTIVVVPLSTGPQAAPPLAVPVHGAGRSAVAVTDQIRAAARERFIRRVGKLSEPDLAAVEEGLRAVLEL
ncbi:MAG TPA: type II toxin-antitoxin system PemK/MazF family toxin [Terriglobia bacterium]|nr:type II toxin-antitoxin system PemK/MazF family toxin [Terriglobia bacterium]